MALGIDLARFIYFNGFVDVAGSADDWEGAVHAVHLEVGGRVAARGKILHRPRRRDSGDVQPFTIRADLGLPLIDPSDIRLVVKHGWGKTTVLADLPAAIVAGERGHRLFSEFLAWLGEAEAGNILEIGSRARSGIERRALVPSGWAYTGIDILPGPNVDLIADAHALSKALPPGHFDGAMSLSVFEHIAMPWKAAVELARVMRVGGRAFIQTHQLYPLHDEPWDYWRISDHAWPTLFNACTGFRVVESAVAERTFAVPNLWSANCNHGFSPGWALTSVIVEKVGEPTVDWDVPVSAITQTVYPA